MANRREFLQGAAAASTLPLIGGAALAASSGSDERPYKTIFDERFLEAREFAASVRLSGARTQGFKSDITSLWFDDLHHRWSTAPAAVAGLTAPNAVFCLERLAWDYGMRLVFLAEHRRSSGGTVGHAVRISNGEIHHAELSAAGRQWTAKLAAYLASVPVGKPRGPASVDLQIAAIDNGATLVSWVIAPKSKASA